MFVGFAGCVRCELELGVGGGFMGFVGFAGFVGFVGFIGFLGFIGSRF